MFIFQTELNVAVRCFYLRAANLRGMRISNLPSNCISCTYEFVVVFIHQHLHITIQFFYLSCDFHMPLQQTIERCLTKLCMQGQCNVSRRRFRNVRQETKILKPRMLTPKHRPKTRSSEETINSTTRIRLSLILPTQSHCLRQICPIQKADSGGHYIAE